VKASEARDLADNKIYHDMVQSIRENANNGFHGCIFFEGHWDVKSIDRLSDDGFTILEEHEHADVIPHSVEVSW